MKYLKRKKKEEDALCDAAQSGSKQRAHHTQSYFAFTDRHSL